MVWIRTASTLLPMGVVLPLKSSARSYAGPVLHIDRHVDLRRSDSQPWKRGPRSPVFYGTPSDMGRARPTQKVSDELPA